jgi:D-alanine-D-alanine ligase
MNGKHRITILYDEAEDIEKAKAEKAGKPFPLAYAQVAEALTKRGHTVQTVAVSKKIRNLVAVIDKDTSDVIFNLCEAIASSSKHEHNVVGLLELFQKCFTGCGSAAWLLAGDKALSKKILQFHNIAYPRFCTFEKGKVDWADDLEFPLIVKPLNEDASIGIDNGSVVHNVKDLLERISYIHEQFDGASLVEEFIDGREIYVGILGNDRPEAFPILEWDFSNVKDSPKIAGSEAKWDRDSEAYKAPEVFPTDIPDEVVHGIKSAALTAFQALELSGYGRVDMRLRRRGDTWDYPIIEVNPNCWLEKRGEFAAAARKHGLTYPELLERITELALARRPQRTL